MEREPGGHGRKKGKREGGKEALKHNCELHTNSVQEGQGYRAQA